MNTAGSVQELAYNVDQNLLKFGNDLGMSGDQYAAVRNWLGKATLAGGLLGTLSGAVDVANGIKEHDVKQVVGGVGSMASGVSAMTSDTVVYSSKVMAGLYQSGKVSARAFEKLSSFSNVAGGVGGAITAFTGMVDCYDGAQNGDGFAIASGVFETISGGTAVAAACCPAAAPVLLAISGVCILIHFGPDLFNPNA